MDETGLALRPFLNPWVLAALGAVCVLLSALAYRRTTRPISPATRRVLLGLRFVTVALLVLCLFRPSLERTHYETIKRPLLLMLDKSRSMREIADTPTEVTRLAAVNQVLADNRAELDELAEKYDVVRVDFARGLVPADADPRGPEVSYSAYGASLQQALEEAVGTQVDAAVVMGDFKHNAGAPDPVDVAASLGEQGVPVYTVGVGQDEATSELRDVKVLSLTAPKTALVFSIVPVRAQIQFRGCQGRDATVALTMQGQPPLHQTVTVGHPDEVVPVEFQLRPEEIGDYKLDLTVAPLPDELLATNNTAGTYMKVVSRGVRAGIFDVVRPESKFLARALEGAQNLVSRRELLLPGQTLSPEQSDVDRYDVVVIGDLAYSAMMPSRVIELRNAVQEEGKGLVLLVTPTAAGPRGWRGTPLAEILAVTLEPDVGIDEGEKPFTVSPAYADHPVVELGETTEATLNAWKEMAPLAGAVTGVKPKRGATVLATDGDGNPLLVVQQAGKGRVACLMADTTFRWFFTRRDTQDYYRRFWRQLVTWTGGWDEEPEGRLVVDLSRQELLVGETVKVTVSRSAGDLAALRDAQLELRVTDPGGQESELPATFSRQRNAYLAEYTAGEPGDYLVSAEATMNGEDAGSDRSHFHASRMDLELEDPAADLKLARRISAVTEEAGGRYYYLPQSDDLFERLKERANPLKLTTRRRRDIWDNAAVYSLLAACMTAEWILRKRKGLV